MQQRDYILREIEKISVLILGMIGRLRRIETGKQFEQERESLYKDVQEATGMTINKLLEVDIDDMEQLLTRENGFDNTNIDMLSELLYEFSFHLEKDERELCIRKAIFILEWLSQEERTFDLERERRLSEYRDAL